MPNKHDQGNMSGFVVPSMSRIVENVGAFVKNGMREVVFSSGSDKEIKVFPSRCGLCVCRCCIPLTNRGRDVCEVVAKEGEVQFTGSFIIVETPNCGASVTENERVCIN